MSFAQQVKSSLLEIILGMSAHPEDFSKHPGTDFFRNRKWDFPPVTTHHFNGGGHRKGRAAEVLLL